MTRLQRPSSSQRSSLLWMGAGALIILLCESLLFIDIIAHDRGPLHTHAEIQSFKESHPPTTYLQRRARFVAINMTALVWVGYLVFLHGALSLSRRGCPITRRPHHFFLLALASIFIWCIFDWINFYSIRAWRYIGMPESHAHRMLGYFLAFATIVPGMLLSGQLLMNLRCFDWARFRPWQRMPGAVLWISLLVGAAMFIWPLVHPDPITNLTLWTSLVFFLDPINYWLGRPSMFRDWRNGWYGRTLACFAGGLLCGFLWEFWNYWALTKWTYHLPFLGSLEQYRYFEMPIPGLLGFLPFGIECWIMWQTMRIFLDGLAEPLPDDRALL